MWCDWSKRQQVSRQACCSSRQFENSLGTFGYTYGPIWEFRARLDRIPDGLQQTPPSSGSS